QRKQSTKRTKPQTTTKKDPRKKTTKGKALTTPPSLDQGSSQPANSSRFTSNDNSVVGSSTVFTKPTGSGTESYAISSMEGPVTMQTGNPVNVSVEQR